MMKVPHSFHRMLKMARLVSKLILMTVAIVSASDHFVFSDDKTPQKEWPFNKLAKPNLPSVKNQNWVVNDIDRFILEGLEKNGWNPAPRATKRQLLRRLYFDLIGLPPSPEETKSFLEDKSPEAYNKLVAKLLNDPRYGERWARLWLDLARYADTAGYEGDPDLPHAWRYRDYVIDAFNNDKPFNQFIKEQIAGDEFQDVMGAGDLPDTPAEKVVAMTFLRLAPFTEPRGDESRHELLSEMTSTVGSVFLGLTVGCAKCHDHKHDNIPTKDFYRMKAFFATVAIPRPERGDGFQIGGPLPAEFYRPGEKEWVQNKTKELKRQLDLSKTELPKLEKKIRDKLGSFAGFGIQAMGGPLGNDYFFDRASINDGKLHWNLISSNGSRWQFFTDGKAADQTGSLAGSNKGTWLGDIPNPNHVALGQYSEGKGKITTAGAHHQGSFAEIMIFDHELSADERDKLDKYVETKYRKGKNFKIDIDGLSFWLDAGDIDANPRTPNPRQGEKVKSWTDKISGINLKQQNPSLQPTLGVAGKAPAVLFDNHFLLGDSKKKGFLKNQVGSLFIIHTCNHKHEGYGFEIGGNGEYLSTFVNPAAGSKMDLASAFDAPEGSRISKEDKDRYFFLASRQKFTSQHLKRLRPVAMSLRHSYGPPYEPGVPTSTVKIRGEYDNPGEVVQPGFLSVISGNQKPAAIRLDPFKRWPTRSRRMALANWIASEHNPLTARVMVNRLWHWHFGRGIVATPSDFGSLSGGPSHKELLDWLALQFVQHNWSIKKIHKLIVTSNTYKQSSLHKNNAAHSKDPENKMLWRFRRKRLEAEAIRDSILAVSGRLNPERYGLPIFPPLPNDIAERVKYSDTKWDTQHGPEGRKRSIYIYQQRTLTMPLMQTFDSLVCEQSRPKRISSTTPLQALAMMNGEFVNEESRHFADRVNKTAGDAIEKQIDTAFQIALARDASEDEMQLFKNYLSKHENKNIGLESICKILLNSNEFIYMD